MSTKKFLLEEKDIPTAWYNIVADMKNKPLPILNPQTKQPLKEEDLYPLFSKGVSHQEMNTTDTWIEIPDEVRELYIKFRFRKEPEFEYRGLLKPPIRNAIITAGKRKPACGPYPDARIRPQCRAYG